MTVVGQESWRKELDIAITDALADPDIASATKEIGVDVDQMRGEVEHRSREVESATLTEFSRLDDAERRFNGVQWKLYGLEDLRDRARMVVVVLLVILCVALAILALIPGTRNALLPLGWIVGASAIAMLIGSYTALHVITKLRHNQVVAGPEYTIAESSVTTAQNEWRAAVRRVVAGLLREEINRHQPSYDLTLDISEPKGLAELSDPQFLIPLPAAAEIDRLISTMPGGSIGISGPRGIGKTTLLRRYCSKEHAPAGGPTEGPPPVRVLMPAPVKYDAREFVILLFSSLCIAVSPPLAGRRAPAPRLDYRSRRMLEVLIAYVTTFTLAWGTFLLIASARGWNISPNMSPAIVLIFASLIGFSILLYSRARRLAVPEFRGIRHEYGEEAAEAHELLQGLSYQQSVSHTWSAGVKTPIGLEGGTSSNVTMTDKPMSFPEIVTRLNDFLRKLSENRKVFIGIDELDKIDSDEQVYQFINDIKGIFGQYNCFYFISISDNAMSSFERRGLPVRDAFDSALDTVVPVDLASLEMSRTLMRRRVIGMPEAFICLCHVISGGLPRDLIRAGRDIVSLTRGNPGPPQTLSALTQTMVRADLCRKAHALEVATQHIDVEPDVGIFVCSLHNTLTARQPTSESLLPVMDLLTAGLTSSASTPDYARTAQKELNRLRMETATYVYFCSTLLGIFNDSLHEPAVRQLVAASGDGSLARLAEARQDFAINPRLAWATIAAFRQAHAFPSSPAYPEPPTPKSGPQADHRPRWRRSGL